jgi:hypothetical protein
MAHDGHTPGDPDASPVTPADTRTDRTLDRSVETRPRALYLWQIAVLEARLDAQRARADRAERDRQHVIDRYEGLLDDRATGELYTDGGRATERTEPAESAAGRGLFDRLRSLL